MRKDWRRSQRRTHTEEESGCGSLGVKQAYDRIWLHVVNPILTPRGSGTLTVLQHGLTGPHTRSHTVNGLAS